MAERELKTVDDYTEEELDAIVEEMKKPIRELEVGVARLLMAHLGFEALMQAAVERGITDLEGMKEHLCGAFDAFWKENQPEPYHSQRQ